MAVSANRARASRLLVGGLAGWHGGLAVAVLAGIALGGALGLVSAVMGAALSLVYYAVGQGVQVRYADAAPRALRAASVWSYVLRVLALGVLLYAAVTWPVVLDRVDTRALFAGIVLGVVGWLVGLVWTFRRLRIPVFDEPAPRQDDPPEKGC